MGSATALFGLAAHRHVWRGPPIPVPWGVVLALLTAFAVVLAAAVLAQTAGLLGAAGSWALTALWLQTPRPEGDILVIADPLGLVFLFGGMVVVTVAVVVGLGSVRRRSA